MASGASDDCVSYNNAVSSRRRQSSSALGKAVKVEDDGNGSSDDESLYRHDGSSTYNNIPSKPVQSEEENISSSSSARLKSNLMGMGFSSALVEKVIKEHGGADENVLVEALFNYSKENQSPEKSYSWDSSDKEEENNIDEHISNVKIEKSSNPSNTDLDMKSQLLIMDFPENEINVALNRLGVDASLIDLVDFIFAARVADSSGYRIMNDTIDLYNVNVEDKWDEYRDIKPFKKAKPTNKEEASCSRFQQEEHGLYFDTKPNVQHMKEEINIPRETNPSPSANNCLAYKPYFFYGSVAELPKETWTKLSNYIYETKPEFVNTQYFSALIREDGYIHNFPTNNRFHIIPKASMSINDAIPNTKKWWPSWDNRKQISFINPDTSGANQVCDRLSKMMKEANGFLSHERKCDFIHHCKSMNLVWVGPNSLRPMEPDHIETILGYPSQHTELHNLQTSDRLGLLKYSFQIDTLGYHLSVLKNMYPNGIRVLSIYSGTGGAEVALHSLGVQLKFVLSVEKSEVKREILKRWWERTGQSGVLKQVAGIERLTTPMLEGYMKDGGFDIVIGSNPGANLSGAVKNSGVDLDFSLYYEFIRVYQRVRSMTGRR